MAVKKQMVTLSLVEGTWKLLAKGRDLKVQIDELDSIGRKIAGGLMVNIRTLIMHTTPSAPLSQFKNDDDSPTQIIAVMMPPGMAPPGRDPYAPKPTQPASLDRVLNLDLTDSDTLIVVDALLKRKREQLETIKLQLMALGIEII